MFVAAEYAPPSTDTFTVDTVLDTLDEVPDTETVGFVNNCLLVGDVIDTVGGGGFDACTAIDVANCNTRFCPWSATHIVPDGSNAMPRGAHRKFGVAVGPPWPDVKSGCPTTTDAALPFVNGALYSSTLFGLPSTTQRLPDGSNDIPIGRLSRVCDVAGPLFVKSDWPITVYASSPFVNGALNSITLLLLLSVSQRLPDGSNVMPPGSFSLHSDRELLQPPKSA